MLLLKQNGRRSANQNQPTQNQFSSEKKYILSGLCRKVLKKCVSNYIGSKLQNYVGPNDTKYLLQLSFITLEIPKDTDVVKNISHCVFGK